jgi:PAS domain S-box-containing protein/putative nucleotidyltransferase with HDIG domain
MEDGAKVSAIEDFKLHVPASTPPRATPVRLLIVEDQPAHAELMVRELRRAAFAPEWNRVETEAAYLEQLMGSPELILADYSLPQFGASRALELLQDRGLDIPFIVVSGTVGEEHAVDLMQRGATDYFLKDRLARLGEAARRALDQQRLRRAKRRGDEELRASEERYRSLFENVPAGLYRSTLGGTMVDVNPAFVKMLGYPDRHTLLSINAAELYHDPGARAQWAALLERDGTVTGFETQLRRFDGSTVWVRASARVVRDSSGRVVYMEGADVDITERKRGEEEVRRKAAELQIFYDLSRQLRAAASVEEMYPIIVEQARSLMDAFHGCLSLLNPEGEVFTRAYTVGVPTEKNGSTYPAASTRSGQVARTGIPFVSEDFSGESVPAWMDGSQYRALGSFTIVPVRSEQDIIGTLCLARIKTSEDRAFTEAELHLVEGIAEIAGTAIRRARLHQNLQEAYVQMVLALAQAIESRDSYTSGHSERMVALAERIARELGCSERQVEDVRWGARLHDIGKIGVPDAVLSKPMALTEAEWTVMRQHPVLGEEILNSVERMRGVAKLVRHHQERWDGTGYPDRLSAEAIPLGSRILAVVDAYGAITEIRPYKPARPHAEAVAEIRRCAGTQFDPRVAELFCRVVEGLHK